jgi:hypothetical protein
LSLALVLEASPVLTKMASVIRLTERTGELDVAVFESAAMPSSISVLSDNVADMEFAEV